MTALILKTVIIPVRNPICKVESPVEISIFDLLKHRLCGPLTEEFSDLLKTASMRPDKIHQILNKLPPFHLLMYIDTSWLRYIKAESVPFMRHLHISQFGSQFFRQVLETGRHFICTVLRQEEMIQGRQRII